MNRPAFAILALAGLVIAFLFPAHVARATPRTLTAGSSRAVADPTPTPTDTPEPTGSGAPSPTSVVPLVDISVSNSSASPSATPSETPTPSPSPAPHRRRRGETPSPEPTDSPTDTPTPTDTPVRKILRHLPPRQALTPAPAATPEVTSAPSEAATAAGTEAPARGRAREATEAPDDTDLTSTSIPTQPPTPRPVAPLQPSIPDSLDDPNVQGILTRAIPQLSQFAWMNGTWNAETYEYHGGSKERSLGKNTYVFASTMKGRWIFGGDGQGTDYFYVTFDPFARHWVLSRINANPAYGIWLSKSGWRGNEIVFDSSYSWVNGRQYRRRVSFIHTDARHFNIYDQEELPTGGWLADQMVELTKQ